MPVLIAKWTRRRLNLAPIEHALWLLLLIIAGFGTWCAFEPQLMVMISHISPHF